MTIKELLMANSYPNAWVQGHHTRIVMNEISEFRVYQRVNKDSPASIYGIELYNGLDENMAVRSFVDSENT